MFSKSGYKYELYADALTRVFVDPESDESYASQMSASIYYYRFIIFSAVFLYFYNISCKNQEYTAYIHDINTKYAEIYNDNDYLRKRNAELERLMDIYRKKNENLEIEKAMLEESFVNICKKN